MYPMGTLPIRKPFDLHAEEEQITPRVYAGWFIKKSAIRK